MSFIRTVLGDITPGELGFTYSHEHLVCRPQHWVMAGEDDLLLDDPEKSKEEVLLFKAAGGRSIVDATAVDYGRDIPAVERIARETGVHIIATAGFNKGFLWDALCPNGQETFAQWIDRSSVEELCQFAVHEIQVGMEGTGVRAGQVKFGTGYNSMSPGEIKTLRASSRAHLLTGAPLHSHTESGTMALEQIKLLKEEGVDLHNVSFGHMDRNPDPWMHLRVAETGAYLCFDGIAKIKYGPESTRIQCILALAKRGYQRQILISGDTARKSYYRSYSHALGLPYIIESWAPRLQEEAQEAGLNGKQLVEDLFIHNPRECFTFKK